MVVCEGAFSGCRCQLYFVPTLTQTKRAIDVTTALLPLVHEAPGFGAPTADIGTKVSAKTSSPITRVRMR